MTERLKIYERICCRCQGLYKTTSRKGKICDKCNINNIKKEKKI